MHESSHPKGFSLLARQLKQRSSWESYKVCMKGSKMAHQNGYYSNCNGQVVGERINSPTSSSLDKFSSNGSSPIHLHGMSNGRSASGSSSPTDKHFVVAAIDFGTTYSGYAFSFTRDPDSIHMMRKWEGGDPGVSNQKTPTTLLLKPNGEFHSFGFGARDFYHDLEELEAKKWYYFEKFKMSLHSNQVSLFQK